MKDLKELINQIIETTGNPYNKTIREIVAFFVDNEWFNTTPTYNETSVFINDKDIVAFEEPLTFFLTNEKESNILYDCLLKKYPTTSSYIDKFFKEESTPEDFKFYILDFLLHSLQKDVFLYSDDEMIELLQKASIDLNKQYGDHLTFFLSWLKLVTKTQYQHDYIMEKRYKMTIQNEAYDFDDYLQLDYYLFCPDYIEENEMYQKAAQSKNYTDTWLYLSMHFISSIRYTDLQRIYHPYLPYPPEEVIEKVSNGTFTDNDARAVLLSITTRMSVLPLTPNKTSKHSNVPSIKLHIPVSCEVHFGILFALAEAHRQLDGTENTPIIRKISTHREIERYMGEEIGSLFLESDFRSRSATKSYLQMLYQYGDNVLENEGSGISFRGYVLASLARSHKGSYGSFAQTTFEYLKDAKLSGLTPEFVAFELLERGVLSCIVSMLLNMVTNKEYSDIDVKKQTSLVKTLNLSPNEVEKVVSIINASKQQAQLVIQESIHSEDDILTILHRIGNGDAFSKDSDSLCLITAINKVCPYAKRQCIGCKFEISTRSTFFHLIEEYNRNRNIYYDTTDTFVKDKCKYLLTSIIIPKLDEMLNEIKNNYGQEVFEQYEQLLKENT